MKKINTAIITIIAIVIPFCLPCFAGQLGYEEVCKYLVDLDGWEARECEGMKMTGSPIGEMVTASRSYTKDDQSIEAHFFYGTMASNYWSTYEGGVEIDTSQGLVKVVEVDGFNVGISYEKKDQKGGIVVSLVESKEAPAVFVVTFENMPWEEALEIAKKFDWKELQSLIE